MQACPDDCTVNGCSTSTQVDDCVDGDCCAASWIGDGYCDGMDQEFGCDLLCYDEDGGDCAGTAASSFGDEAKTSSEPTSIVSIDGKEYYFSRPVEQTRDELTAIQLWRSSEGSDFEIIAELGADDESYSDTNVMNGTEYTYALTAVYDNGVFVSDFSNIATAMPMSEVSLSLSGGTVQSGETMIVSLSMSNDEPVTGLQLSVEDTPDYFTLLSVEATDRVPADWSITGNADGQILAFIRRY